MKPTKRVWSLTVVDGRLALVAPHGTLFVRGATPEINAIVAGLPAGAELKCRGDGAAITNLVVTEIEAFQSDLTPHARTLPDGAVEHDARLALLRARARLDAGDVSGATADLAIALGRGAGVDGAIAQVGRLPADAREALRDAVARWQHTRPANWRALQDVPLMAWTTVHLGQALKQALAKPAGTFGDTTITAEAMIAELERRGAADEAARWQARLDEQQRPVKPREVGPWMQLSTKLVDAHVIGADADGIYLAGNQLSYEQIRERARTFVREHRTPVVVCYGLDGTERRRWPGAVADRVVDGVMITRGAGGEVRRIADDQVLVRFRDLRRCDDELLWGDVDTESGPASEVRRLTGELVVRFTDERVSDVTWDRDHLFVDGTHPRTLDRRTSRITREGIPTATTVDVELANRRLTLPAAAASWTSHVDWQPKSGGNYRIASRGRCLLVNETPSDRWIVLELAREPQLIDVAPPWLAFWFEVDEARFIGGGGPTAPVRHAQPIVLVAIAELLRAAELRIGEWFARRRALDPADEGFAALVAMHADLVEIGVVPACTDAERDARVLDEWLVGGPPTAATFVRLVKRWSPFYVEHDLDPIGPDDGFYASVSRALVDEGIVVSEAGRQGGRADRVITLRVVRGTTVRERATEPIIDLLDRQLDALLGEVGSTRSLVRIVDDEQRRGYLLVTPAQAARLP